MHGGQKDNTWDEPDEWEFDYQWSVIQDAFWLWSMSGFQRLPNQEEVLAYDPRYMSDIRLAHQIYSHQGNNSAPQQFFEQYLAYTKDPEGYKLGVEAQRMALAQEGSDGVQQGQDGISMNGLGSRGSPNMRSPYRP